MNSTVLETPRLQLREMTPGDLDFVATMLAHPEVNHFYERRFSRAESKEWLSRQLDRYRRDEHGLWLVLDRTTSEPVGQVGLCMQDVEGTRHAEIGWLLHRPFWGKGYATEAGAATRDAAFERWHYDHVISLIRPVNVRSQRVAVRIGMTPGRRVQFHGYEHFVFGMEKPVVFAQGVELARRGRL
jgi:[ribosomal protein S5]-alanine N-acetyltransferase